VEGRASDSAQNIALKEKALRRLEKEYETLNKQLDNAHDLLEQGIYTTDQFLDRSRKLSERIKQNEADRAALSDDIAVDKSREAGRSQIVPKIEKLLDVYWSLPTPKAKNDMLKAVVEKVVYLKERSARYKGNSPDDFEITIYPRIPKA
jgi:chromosome segregation ATPase